MLKAERIQRGSGFLASFTDELVLTSLHLIWVNKGALGNVKSVQNFPLNLIKVYNGQAQVFATRNRNAQPTLEVHFQNGEEEFKFGSGGKREVEKWVAAINRVVTGSEPTPSDSRRSIPGTGLLAEALRGTVSQLKASIDAGKEQDNAPGLQSTPLPPTRVSSTCPGCSAPIAGFSGDVATCEFCESESQLP